MNIKKKFLDKYFFIKKKSLFLYKNKEKNFTREHLEIIYYIIDFYNKFKIPPNMRLLIEFIRKYKNKKINSIYFYKLFPKGGLSQACKIANIPDKYKCN